MPLARNLADVRTVAPFTQPARAREAVPARPAAAHARRPLRDVHRLRPAQGAGRAGHRAVRRADLRRLPRGRRRPPARRRPARAHARARRDLPDARATSRRCSPTAARVTGVRLADGEAPRRRRRGRQRRRHAPLPRPAARPARAPSRSSACAARRRRCPASCCCSPCAVVRRACCTTTCGSPPTTTRSSTRSSAATRKPVDDPTVYVCAPDDDAMRPDADHESWFVLVNAPRHGPPASAARSTGPRPASRESLPRPRARRDGRRAGTTCATACCGREIRTPADLEHEHPRARRLDLRHVEQRRRAPRSCARRTPRRCPGCSSSAARRTPAAACRWWACPPRSSPTSSAAPDAVSPP